MSDRRIRIFHAVAKHLSFTKAAEVLFMSQPAVTFHIRQLEEQLNARLFDRTPRGISLTPAGAVTLEYADRMMAMSTELKTRLREMSGQIAGQLLIGASTTYADLLLPQVLVQFKARYPAVVPRLIVANSETVQTRLLDRTLSVGFIEGDSQQPSLKTEICCSAELYLVCAPSHKLAGAPSVTAESLASYPYVSREAGSGTRNAVDSFLRSCGLSPGVLQVVMEANCASAVKALVAAGAGFSIMSWSSVTREVRLGELCRIALSPRLHRSLSVVYPRERVHSRLINGFLGFAKERIGAMHLIEELERIPERAVPGKSSAKPTQRGARSAAPLTPRS